MIYFKLFNLSNQTAQPGTVQNIKHRFHHNKASKNISNFYACYDLMEITTLSNLIALAIEVSGLNFEATDAHLSAEAFNDVVAALFDKIDRLSKWDTREIEEGTENEADFDDSDDDEDDDRNEYEDGRNADMTDEANSNTDEDELLNYHLGLFYKLIMALKGLS